MRSASKSYGGANAGMGAQLRAIEHYVGGDETPDPEHRHKVRPARRVARGAVGCAHD